MTIINSYTGNALLNNALMTIEALGKLNHVSEITPELILELYQAFDLIGLNKRLKSYTMLFTKNGPLKNDAINGEQIYSELFRHFTHCIELEGDKECEISGLRFSKTFDQLFGEVLSNIGLSKKEIEKKDTTVNRAWFPLIGGLGSDAQALPQAKFSVQIHPIVIPILQFLPLSAVLYKGGILLIDSSNFKFSREFISRNVNDVRKRIELTQEGEPIENLKNFAKGNYLLRAIEILEDKNFDYEDDYTDLNLWSFTNSGTGARCEIERVPNGLIKKVLRLKNNPQVSPELVNILSSPETAYRFLEALENNQDWYGLYPNVYGSGKKKKESDGVSVSFLEAYFKEINSPNKTDYAKFIAFLVEKYKTDAFSKYLFKRDAWGSINFKTDLYAVLVKATENGEWSMVNQLDILDEPKTVPVKNNFYGILKITHYYYYKKAFSRQAPKVINTETEVKKVLDWLISLICSDSRKETLVKRLTHVQTFASTPFFPLIYRNSWKSEVDLETIFYALYNKQFKSTRYGLNELLRMFFCQPHLQDIPLSILEKRKDWKLERTTAKWLGQLAEFAGDYQKYYFDKYGDFENGSIPVKKFLKLVESIPEESSGFLIWLYQALENTNQFLINQEQPIQKKWSDGLLYSPNGEYSQAFARMAIKVSLLKNIYSL